MRGKRALVGPRRVPARARFASSDCHELADGSIPSIRSVRSPVSGMNGRINSAITRTASAATTRTVSSSARRRILRHDPRLARDDVAIRRADDVPDFAQRDAQLKRGDRGLDALDDRIEPLPEVGFLRPRQQRRVRRRHDSAAIPVNHRRRAADQVAQIVGEIRVVARQERLVGEAGVLAEHHLAEHEVAEARPDRTGRCSPAAARRCRATWTSSRLPSATSRG